MSKTVAVRRGPGRPRGTFAKQSGMQAVAAKVRSNPNISSEELARRVRKYGLAPATLTLYRLAAQAMLRVL